jgi:RNA recognition motif-containing protein
MTQAHQSQPTGAPLLRCVHRPSSTDHSSSETKHRGFAFVTFTSAGDAQDAIDNMDMNELHGRVLKVNLARPMKAQPQLQGNRAGTYFRLAIFSTLLIPTDTHSMGI